MRRQTEERKKDKRKTHVLIYLKVCKRAEETVKELFLNKIGRSGGVEVSRSRWAGGVEGTRKVRRSRGQEESRSGGVEVRRSR